MGRSRRSGSSRSASTRRRSTGARSSRSSSAAPWTRRARPGGCGPSSTARSAWAKHAADRLAGQASIFDGGFGEAEANDERHHPPISSAEFDERELLRLEKETLGLYVSEHPLEKVKAELRRKTDCTLSDVERRRDGEIVVVGGIVAGVKQLTTKRGEPMVFATLEDDRKRRGGRLQLHGPRRQEHLETDRMLIVKGRVDHKQAGETKLVALEVRRSSRPRTARSASAYRRSAGPAGLIRELAALVKDFPGEAPVYVALETSLGERTLALGPDYRVKPDADFFAEARVLLGEAALA